MDRDSLNQTSLQQLVDIMRKTGDANRMVEHVSTFDQILDTLPVGDLSRIDWLLTVGEILYEKGQYKDASRLLQLGLEQAQKTHTKGKQALALGLLADLNRVQGNYRSALTDLVRAREVLGENPVQDKDISARLHIISGLNNMSLGEYETSRASFYEAYQLFNQIGDSKGKIFATNRLGTIHTMLFQYDDAEKYLQESLQLSKQVGDRHATAGSLLNLGEIRRLQNKPVDAKPFYYEAGALFSSLGMPRGVAIAENNLGHIAVALREYDVAKYHYSHAVEYAKGADLVPDLLDTLAGMVFVLVHRNQFADATQLIRFILGHPAHLQETEEFLQTAWQAIDAKDLQLDMETPPPDQLDQVISQTLEKVFS